MSEYIAELRTDGASAQFLNGGLETEKHAGEHK